MALRGLEDYFFEVLLSTAAKGKERTYTPCILCVSPKKHKLLYVTEESVLHELPFGKVMNVLAHAKDENVFFIRILTERRQEAKEWEKNKGKTSNQNVISAVEHRLEYPKQREPLMFLISSMCAGDSESASKDFGDRPETHMEGPTKKHGKLKWSDRYLVLNSYRLCVFRNITTRRAPHHPPANVIFLPGCTITAVAANSILINSPRKRFEFAFASKQERDTWMAALQKEMAPHKRDGPHKDLLLHDDQFASESAVPPSPIMVASSASSSPVGSPRSHKDLSSSASAAQSAANTLAVRLSSQPQKLSSDIFTYPTNSPPVSPKRAPVTPHDRQISPLNSVHAPKNNGSPIDSQTFTPPADTPSPSPSTTAHGHERTSSRQLNKSALTTALASKAQHLPPTHRSTPSGAGLTPPAAASASAVLSSGRGSPLRTPTTPETAPEDDDSAPPPPPLSVDDYPEDCQPADLPPPPADYEEEKYSGRDRNTSSITAKNRLSDDGAHRKHKISNSVPPPPPDDLPPPPEEEVRPPSRQHSRVPSASITPPQHHGNSTDQMVPLPRPASLLSNRNTTTHNREPSLPPPPEEYPVRKRTVTSSPVLTSTPPPAPSTPPAGAVPPPAGKPAISRQTSAVNTSPASFASAPPPPPAPDDGDYGDEDDEDDDEEVIIRHGSGADDLPPPPEAMKPSSTSGSFPAASASAVASSPVAAAPPATLVSASLAFGLIRINLFLESSNTPLGFLMVPANSTLDSLRSLMSDELDSAPLEFSFLASDNVPVGKRQESKTAIQDVFHVAPKQSALSVYLRAVTVKKSDDEKKSSSLSLTIYLKGDDEPLGLIEVSDVENTSLEQLRGQMHEELDELPQDFVFLLNDVPLGRKQESKKPISSLALKSGSLYIRLPKPTTKPATGNTPTNAADAAANSSEPVLTNAPTPTATPALVPPTLSTPEPPPTPPIPEAPPLQAANTTVNDADVTALAPTSTSSESSTSYSSTSTPLADRVDNSPASALAEALRKGHKALLRTASHAKGGSDGSSAGGPKQDLMTSLSNALLNRRSNMAGQTGFAAAAAVAAAKKPATVQAKITRPNQSDDVVWE